jgi:NAD(P)H-dependent FMN reductase
VDQAPQAKAAGGVKNPIDVSSRDRPPPNRCQPGSEARSPLRSAPADRAAWMRMITIPNQSSVPKAWGEFDEAGRMRPSPLYDRIVDLMEELVKFTHLTRGRSAYLTDRYSERVETAAEVSRRVNQRSL